MDHKVLFTTGTGSTPSCCEGGEFSHPKRTCTHTCMHKCIHMHACMQAHIHTCTNTYMHAHMHRHTGFLEKEKTCATLIFILLWRKFKEATASEEFKWSGIFSNQTTHLLFLLRAVGASELGLPQA